MHHLVRSRRTLPLRGLPYLKLPKVVVSQLNSSLSLENTLLMERTRKDSLEGSFHEISTSSFVRLLDLGRTKTAFSSQLGCTILSGVGGRCRCAVYLISSCRRSSLVS